MNKFKNWLMDDDVFNGFVAGSIAFMLAIVLSCLLVAIMLFAAAIHWMVFYTVLIGSWALVVRAYIRSERKHHE